MLEKRSPPKNVHMHPRGHSSSPSIPGDGSKKIKIVRENVQNWCVSIKNRFDSSKLQFSFHLRNIFMSDFTLLHKTINKHVWTWLKSGVKIYHYVTQNWFTINSANQLTELLFVEPGSIGPVNSSGMKCWQLNQNKGWNDKYFSCPSKFWKLKKNF